MKSLSRISMGIALLLFSHSLWGQSFPKIIEVFVNATSHQVRGIAWTKGTRMDVQIKNVAPIVELENYLTSRITPNPNKTSRFINSYIQSMEKSTQQRVIAAGIHRAAAQSYGIRVYPSIVIDRRFLFEDEADLRRAVYLWRRLPKN